MSKSKILTLIILALILIFSSFIISANAQGGQVDLEGIKTKEAVEQLKNIQEDFMIIESKQTDLTLGAHIIEQSAIHIDRFILALAVLFMALILCMVLATKNGLIFQQQNTVKKDTELELKELASDQ